MVNPLWYKLLSLTSWLTIFVVFPFEQHRVLAQITPDTTLEAESSRITPNVEVRGSLADLIEGGAERGANLFHSFGEFNVQELQRVYFANPVGIENILTRVTGANPSHIFGTLGVDGAANLYFLNPHGILFGANAQLDVEGSFVASTANSLTFEDGSTFSAANLGDSSVLTISVPLGLQYGTNQTGVITNRGNLSAGQDLTLSAGNLDLQGQLAAGGDLTLEAQDTVQIRDSGTVPFTAVAGEQLLVQGKEEVDIFALNHPDSGLFSGEDMVLRSASTVLGDAHYWSGGSFRIEQLDGSLGDLESPNDPVIRADGDVFFDSYVGISLHIFAGGSVEINDSIEITGPDLVNGLQETVTLSDGTTIQIDGKNEPTVDIRANADITIGVILNNGGKVFLTNQYQPNLLLDTPNGITVSSIDVRDNFGGGSVIIDSRGGITLNDTVDVSALDVFSGNGGDVKLIAQGDITLNQGANIFSYGLLGGDITFNSGRDISLTDSLIRNGNFINLEGVMGGEIQITANSLSLTESSVLATTTSGAGDAGAVKITATDSVRLDGESKTGNTSGIFSQVNSGAEGDSGGIELTTSSLELTNGAQVSASTFGVGDAGAVKITVTDSIRLDGESNNGILSGIFSQVNSEAEGNSGGIELTASTLEVTNGAQVGASTFGEGNAGAVKITATDSVQLDGESSDRTASGIFSTVESEAQGNSEGIELTTATLELTNGAQVDASTAGVGDAGNIFVRNAQSVFLSNKSSISTAVEPNSSGIGGDINIQTNSLTLENNSRISARSQAPGKAGDININVSETLTATDSDITTSSTQSAGGAINIIAKDIRLRGDSDITTSVFSGVDNGGNITITTDSLIAFADSDILAFVRDGRGGDITFLTPIFFGFAFRPAPKGTDPVTLDLNNRVDINASGAVDGVITLPNLDFITNSLTVLQDNLIDTDNLLANSCIVRTIEQKGTFIITGGGNLPTRPGDASSSTYPTGVVRTIPSDSPTRPWQKGDPIIQPTGVYQLPDGRLVMARECS
ncbi:MAG: filamentous hemagglutinin N-terminal domain-containing protein [Symploca sp. SIO1C2]|nr:filamentous hemagglutinin N-terminal domain-containing protein [Symploca sp. SIO1C2]